MANYDNSNWWLNNPTTNPAKANDAKYGNVGGNRVEGLDLNFWKQFNPGTKNSLGNEPFKKIAELLGTGMFPLLLQQMQQAYKNEPARQSAIQRAMSAAEPGNRQAALDAMRARLMGSSVRQGKQAAYSARSQGLGEGFAQGAMMDAENRATDTANVAQAQAYSPEAEMQQAQMLLQLISGSQAMPGLEQFLALAGPGTHQQQQQPGSPTFLSQLLGGAAAVAPFFL